MSDEEPEQMSSQAAGAAVLTIASGGVGLAVFTYSRDAFVLLVWALGAGAVWWAARKGPSTPNPAPPAPPERGPEEEPQVKMVRDPGHPNRWIALRPSHWITEKIEKETGT